MALYILLPMDAASGKFVNLL